MMPRVNFLTSQPLYSIDGMPVVELLRQTLINAVDRKIQVQGVSSSAKELL